MVNFWTLGNFLKPLAAINLSKSPTFLGKFCKGVKIFHFSSEIIFGQLLWTFGYFLLVTLVVTNRHCSKDRTHSVFQNTGQWLWRNCFQNKRIKVWVMPSAIFIEHLLAFECWKEEKESENGSFRKQFVPDYAFNIYRHTTYMHTYIAR